MELELKVFSYLCELDNFIINGVEADYYDFGEKYDHNPEEAEDYGCGNMKFISKPSTSKILEKYKITVEEYNEICNELKDKLSFGYCGWCI